MRSTPPSAPFSQGQGDQSWAAGGGGMGDLLRHHDWSSHPLGPLELWPQSLRTAVSICLSSRFPMILWCGPEFHILYNDAYAPTLGVKHPAAFGLPGAVAWREIWPVIHPMLQQVVTSGVATWSEDQLLFLERSGYREETYHTFSYSPIRGEDGHVSGVFTAVNETTLRVLSERRLHTLREVAARTAKTRTVDEACEAALAALRERHEDCPFAAIYVRHPADPDSLQLKGTLRLTVGGTAAPWQLRVGDGPWPTQRVLIDSESVLITDLAGLGLLPGGAWDESPTQAMVLPITAAENVTTVGMVVVGVNARRKVDDQYQGFFDLLAGQIATAVQRADAYEAEKRRATALAEIDRAKTVFFSNVSHEFRTPLTLMLGPIEDLLRESGDTMNPQQVQHIDVLHRNALRLLKLVNTLLDFSRIEAGRVTAEYKPTNLGSFTTDLASAFRSAIERAGMQLHVDCPALGEPVFVDHDMWEKIVLNLLSNAFKYTLAGSIHVRLRLVDTAVVLSVADTGVGIPQHELAHLFERFHRVQGVHGRTHEGTGIGLALVQELVKLHGGSVTVHSTPGQGSTFTVSVPRGREHLAPEQVVSAGSPSHTALGVDAFIEEAMRWLPDSAQSPATAHATSSSDHNVPSTLPRDSTTASRARIVLADDNADMRDYVRRLLAPQFEVIAVPDGAMALEAVRNHTPDLVLSDVMMPVLDGFGLIRAIRAEPAIRATPVILLSARAGEESRIDGLQSGADDYLVKPFSARELLARVAALLDMERMRREAAAERDRLLERERAAVRHRDEFLGIASHELRTPITSLRLQLDLTHRALQRYGDLQHVPAERIRKMMDTFDHQVNNLSALIDDLLDVSRIANGRLSIEPESVDLLQLVNTVIHQHSEQMNHAHCSTHLHAPAPVVGFWDPKRLEQVVVNLLLNAAKYAAGKPVYVEVSQHGAKARLVVRDEGMGISTDNQARIFHRFERAIGRSNISGLGLGLYIVKEIVQAHQGTINVNSTLGVGSEFVVDLPMQLGP